MLTQPHLTPLFGYAGSDCAAGALHLPQPRLLKSIQRLVTELGVMRLERQRGPIAPTVFCRHVFERVAGMLTEGQDLQREMQR